MSRMDEISEQLQLLTLSTAMEAVFENTSLTDKIWNDLNTKDLLEASLVSKNWYRKSRKKLKSNNRKQPVRIRIKDETPCRTLLKFNEFLTETYDSEDETIIFNGINHSHGYEDMANPDELICPNCLMTDWKSDPPAEGIMDEADEDIMITDNLRAAYGNILKKMQFNYLRLENRLPPSCPFAKLIKLVLTERAEEILELDFDCDQLVHDQLIPFLLQNVGSEVLMTFPNLEVLGMKYCTEEEERQVFPIIAPSLKKIKHFSYKPLVSNLAPNFPRHALTKVELIPFSPESTTAIFELIQEHKPKINFLQFCVEESGRIFSDQHKRHLYKIGQLVSSTLEFLECSAAILIYLACNFEDDENSVGEIGENLKKNFPALTKISLRGYVDVETMDNFYGMDLVKHFPNLEKISVHVRSSIKHVVYSPNNKIVQPLKRVTSFELVHSDEVDSPVALHFFPAFSNIRELSLLTDLFKFDRNDKGFAAVMNKIEELPLLEEITFRLNSIARLNSLNLDHLFVENISEVIETLEKANMANLLLYKTSILDHKNLRKFEIYSDKVLCKRRVNNNGDTMCYSDQQPGHFFVSSHTARLICQRLQKFRVRVNISGACSPSCSSGVYPGGLRVEHLEPHAKIDVLQDKSTFYDIEFNGEDEEESSMEELPSNNGNQANLFKISDEIPCRALLKLNAQLDETYDSTSEDDKVIFNGIHYSRSYGEWISPEELQCSDCLVNDWKSNLPAEADEILIVNYLRAVYGNIWKKMQFKYLRFESRFPPSCPFAKLIKIVLNERAEEILELDFGDDPMVNEHIIPCVFNNLNGRMTFPKLEVLGIKYFNISKDGGQVFPIIAPSLKKINHFRYNLDSNLPANFPYHALTKVGHIPCNLEVTKSALEFIQENKPEIEYLNFDGEQRSKIFTEEHQHCLHNFGRLVSSTLNSLECSPAILIFLACKINFEHNDDSSKNGFPALGKIQLRGHVGVETMDNFCGLNFAKQFPALERISLELGPEIDQVIYGPYNKFIQSTKEFRGVTFLELVQHEADCSASKFFNGFSPSMFRISTFSYIQKLSLSRVSFKLDRYDEGFAAVMNEIENLPFLERIFLSVKSAAQLNLLNLDHLFVENISEIKEALKGVNVPNLLVYKTSILDHKNLRLLAIYSDKVLCQSRVNNTGDAVCYSDQLPGHFLVSSQTAQNICKRLPKFQIRVTISDFCKPSCSSGVYPGGLRLEHLEPHAKIEATHKKGGVVVSTSYEIEFKCEEESHMEKQLLKPINRATVVESVFTNALLMDEIWKHLGTKDLLEASLVSQSWLIKSRKELKSSKRKQSVSIHLRDEIPCRALLKFNKLLETTHESEDETIMFNGVHHRCDSGSWVYPDELYCPDCLMNDWKRDLSAEELTAEAEDIMLTDNLRAAYGNILKKIQFKYLRFESRFPPSCPFAKLIKLILSERAKEILELDFNCDQLVYDQLIPYLLQNVGGNVRMTFPKLEVLGMKSLPEEEEGQVLPVIVPSLKKLKHYCYNPIENNLALNFPRHALTKVESIPFSLESTTAMFELIQEHKPKIEFLEFRAEESDEIFSDEQRRQLFNLGRLVSSTLNNLDCSAAILISLAWNFQDDDIDEDSKHCFPALTQLKLKGYVGVETMDILCGMDFAKHFPKLEEITADICHEFDHTVHGPYNKFFQPLSDFKEVTSFALSHYDADALQGALNFSAGFCPTLFRISTFTYIQSISLLTDLFNFDRNDEGFAAVMNEIEDLPFLEGIFLWVNSTSRLNLLNLDHLFVENITQVQETLERINMPDLLVFKTSILDHKSFKRLTIFGNKVLCKSRLNNNGDPICYSDQLPGTALISSQTAQLICKRLEKFEVSVNISDFCYSCSSAVYPGGLKLEHLEPYAKIDVSHAKGGLVVSTRYDIEFKCERES